MVSKLNNTQHDRANTELGECRRSASIGLCTSLDNEETGPQRAFSGIDSCWIEMPELITYWVSTEFTDLWGLLVKLYIRERGHRTNRKAGFFSWMSSAVLLNKCQWDKEKKAKTPQNGSSGGVWPKCYDIVAVPEYPHTGRHWTKLPHKMCFEVAHCPCLFFHCPIPVTEQKIS